MSRRMNLVFVGDSLTEAFDWQSRFPSYEVHNLGLSGEPVDGLINRVLEGYVAETKPDILFVMTGINNLWRGDHDILERYESLLSALSRTLPQTRIIVQSILPVTMWVPPAIIEEINAALKKMASEYRMEYLDLHTLFLLPDGTPDATCFEEDGVHLEAEGYRRWSAAVERFLHEK